jgi:acetyl-CoA carboxylase biotin carboxyl carrier protein
VRTPVEVTAELTASVVRLAVQPGAFVEEGDTLLVVESMKMEIPISAPIGGRVQELRVGPQDVVAEGDILAVLASDG